MISNVKSPKMLLLLSAMVISFSIQAQKVAPEILEVWEPVPALVTPGENNAPPSDAIVLFNGKDLSQWKGKEGEAKWTVKDGAMTVAKGTGEISTKKEFGDIQLHLEFREPTEIVGESQGRGNSGVFLQGLYEVQVLDMYNNKTYVNGQTGSIYKQTPPLVNVCKKPGEWQTYDIFYTAPIFSEKGTVIKPAYVTVVQNGVLVQNHTEIKGPTEYEMIPRYKKHGKASLVLQDHGNPVSFRNIWVREL
jgi:hypothetical protein